jgi:hypothetical protein
MQAYVLEAAVALLSIALPDTVVVLDSWALQASAASRSKYR